MRDMTEAEWIIIVAIMLICIGCTVLWMVYVQ
jgi:hypothetical protein